MPHAEVNGQRLYYEVHGEGEPLVLVMGLGGDLLAWARQIPEWSTRYRLIAIENRDVGRSSYADGPYEIADMAADTLAVIDELGIDTFHLLGVSMGGAISQSLALSAPERVRTLTLCVTWGGSGPYGAARSEVLGRQYARMSTEEQVDFLMLLTMSERFYADPGAVAWLRGMILSNPNPQKSEGFVRQLDACGRHDVRDRLGELSMPVHVIGAAHDQMVPPWKSTELADLIPSAKLTMVDGAPHMVSIEDAEQFNAAVVGFLEEHGAPAPSQAIGPGSRPPGLSAPSRTAAAHLRSHQCIAAGRKPRHSGVCSQSASVSRRTMRPVAPRPTSSSAAPMRPTGMLAASAAMASITGAMPIIAAIQPSTAFAPSMPMLSTT